MEESPGHGPFVAALFAWGLAMAHYEGAGIAGMLLTALTNAATDQMCLKGRNRARMSVLEEATGE